MNSPNPYAPPKSPVADVDERGDPETALASRGQRLGAAMLDSIIAMVWTIPLGLYLGVWSAAFRQQPIPFQKSLLMAVLGFVLFMGVNSPFLRSNGQTIGKKLVGIRIVSMEYAVPDLWRIILLRYAPISLAGLIPVVGPLASFVDILFIFGASRRCVHDLIAGTQVVGVRRKAA